MRQGDEEAIEKLSFQSKNCRNQKNIRRNRCRINLWSNGRCISSPVNYLFSGIMQQTEFKRSNSNCAVFVLECSLDTDSAKRNYIQSHHTTGLVSSAGRFRHLFIHYGTSGFEQL